MTKFEPAFISDAEIIGTLDAWMKLWEAGDVNTIMVTGPNATREQARERLFHYCKNHVMGKTFMNDKYQVVVNQVTADGLYHLSIKRLDRSHEHDWREYQQIKNELLGPECEAVELYPAESRLVDCANQFHLWGYKDPEFRFPLGFEHRMIADHGEEVGKSQQRPFEKQEKTE